MWKRKREREECLWCQGATFDELTESLMRDPVDHFKRARRHYDLHVRL